MTEPELAEFVQLRSQLRQHLAALAEAGRDPLDGTLWGPLVDRYDGLLFAMATAANIPNDFGARDNAARVAVDERCRTARLFDGPSLIPDAAP